MAIVLVTGAGSGIGRAVARGFLDAGHQVVLAGRREGPLHETAATAPDASLVMVHSCDVTDEAAVDGLFDAAVARFGRLDVLFNNAGISGPRVEFPDTPLAGWEQTVATNLTGAFLCARAAFRIMAGQSPRGGRIINNGSISAHVPRPHSAAYTATKHAITGLTKSISLDGRAYDVACGQIDIGNAYTEMSAGSTRGALQPDGAVRVEPSFDVAHVASTVRSMAELPLDANVQFLTITATTMPFIGRG